MNLNSTLIKMRELELETELGTPVEQDEDVCNQKKLLNLFSSCTNLTSKPIATTKYILHITGTIENNPYVGVGLSNHCCSVYHFNNSELAHITTFSEHNDVIIGIQCSEENNNLWYTGSSDGTIRLWDLRSPNKSKITFRDTTMNNGTHKTFTCFDLSPNRRLLTAGTNLYKGDSFLLFWDLRKNNLLGGYWESHTDDITQVKFHPYDSNKLISGSTDGLINIYDLSQTSEDDALIDTLNTDSSIEKLQWHDDCGNEIVSCITHTADVQLWKTEQAQPYLHFHRSDTAKYIMRTSKAYIYIVDVHKNNDGLFVLSGSNYNDGEVLRSIKIGKSVQPALQFEANRQIVRTSWYNSNINLLVTGGEKGIIDFWTLPDNSSSKKGDIKLK